MGTGPAAQEERTWAVFLGNLWVAGSNSPCRYFFRSRRCRRCFWDVQFWWAAYFEGVGSSDVLSSGYLI
jgi:hypothetical protein